MAKSLSEVPLPDGCAVIFDLDDTLYKERDFVISGFRVVAELVAGQEANALHERMVQLFDQRAGDVLEIVRQEFAIETDKSQLIQTIREHQPSIRLSNELKQLLTSLTEKGHPLGLITDGRSVTQRNKIRALSLQSWINEIAISEEVGAEKPLPKSFLRMQETFSGHPLAYVGDNLRKDFVAPNKLGWTTVCLLADEWNVHPQDFGSVPETNKPNYAIEQLA